jgi:hypothetical protein
LTRIRALDEQQALLQRLRAQLKNGERAKSDTVEVPEYVSLTFRNMYDQIELQMQFIAQLKQLLAEPRRKEQRE